MNAVETVETEVRELIRRTGLDPVRETAEVADLVRAAVSDYDERSTHGGLPVLGNVEAAVKAVLDTVAGFGPLQQYFDDPLVEEIWINSPSHVVNYLLETGRRTLLSLTPAARGALPRATAN